MELNLRKARKVEVKINEVLVGHIPTGKMSVREIIQYSDESSLSAEISNAASDFESEFDRRLLLHSVKSRINTMIAEKNVSAGITSLMSIRCMLRFHLHASMEVYNGASEVSVADLMYMAKKADEGSNGANAESDVYGRFSSRSESLGIKTFPLPMLVKGSNKYIKMGYKLLKLKDEIETVEDKLMVLNTETTIKLTDDDCELLKLNRIIV